MSACAICKGTRSLYTIEIPTDDGACNDVRKICGTCWDVIAEVATRRLATRLDAMEKQIKELNEQIPYLQERTS